MANVSPRTDAIRTIRSQLSRLKEGLDYRIECRRLNPQDPKDNHMVAEAKEVPGGQVITSVGFIGILGDCVDVPTPVGRITTSPLDEPTRVLVDDDRQLAAELGGIPRGLSYQV